LVVLGALLVVSTGSVFGQEILGTMTNFDVFNLVGHPVDDFEMCFSGIQDPSCVEGWFDGWGTPPTIFETEDGFCVRWVDCDNGIPDGEDRHFGLYLAPECLEAMLYEGLCIRSYWTVGGIRVMEIPVPEQFWRAENGAIVDIVRYCNDDVGKVTITRWFAAITSRVSLTQLTWNEIDELIREHDGEWTLVEDQMPLEPNGEDIEVRIPVTSRHRAVVVKYEIVWNDQVASRVINATNISPPCD
jgi:hypothetical protein